jgi:predicted Ser/Thr protein kinase
MSDSPLPSRVQLLVWLVLTLCVLLYAVQLTLVRPRMWPAGAGVALSGDALPGVLSEPAPIGRIRPPALPGLLGRPITVVRANSESDAVRAKGLAVDVPVRLAVPGAAAADGAALVRFPERIDDALRLWRAVYRTAPARWAGVRFGRAGAPADADVVLPRDLRPLWQWSGGTRDAWLRAHLGPLLQMGAFLLGAIALVALGSRGLTAMLMTLTLATTTIANGGPTFGAELAIPFIGEWLLLFQWIVTPLSFPLFGLAVLYFPSRAPVLDRHRWIVPLVLLLPVPMLAVGLIAAAFLLGADAALAPLAWLAARGWIFDLSFALALAANIAIVVEGLRRYRINLDANERRRIQIVVFTGVPSVFAYAIRIGVSLLSSLAGRPMELPWGIAGPLQALELLPAFGLPYAVAVRRVFSPRTVLRSGLQYALARRTLSVLVALPVAVLAFSLISERDRPLGAIVFERPWFYAVSLGLAALGFRYRDQAQRWLDRRFFRAEYDAREILIALANRVPYEQDASKLVALVLGQIDSALHPSAIAVLAGSESQLDVVSTLRVTPPPLRSDSALATLLRWSDEPLEVFVDDERSPAGRLPPADRAWLSATGLTLLVPILAGTGEARTLEGVIALGTKRSEEPYTPEDRRLLSGIAAQLSVAHDLSKLRKRASTGLPRAVATPTATPSMVAGTTEPGAPSLAMCPVCRRCFDLDALRGRGGPAQCPDDGSELQPVLGMIPVVDGKYRVDAVIGRGGMGAVFRARDLRLTRDVALKVVRADMVADAEARARFEREAQIVARLQHPAVVTVFDYGHLPNGAAFLVMEYVAGEDLRHLLKRVKTLTAHHALTLVGGVADGVEAAHRSGVLHRDLKPENILLPASGTGPKVLDFGVAKMTDPAAADAGVTATQAGTVIGTPAYMAPEQLRGEPLDPRADVYSLAVVTYEALTGRLPFGSGSFYDIGRNQANAAVDFAAVPAELVEPLARALSLERGARPASAAAFADALRVSFSFRRAP